VEEVDLDLRARASAPDNTIALHPCGTGGSTRIRHSDKSGTAGTSGRRSAMPTEPEPYETMREVSPGGLFFRGKTDRRHQCRSVILLGEPEAYRVRHHRVVLGERWLHVIESMQYGRTRPQERNGERMKRQPFLSWSYGERF
jgi:hypothetical protein